MATPPPFDRVSKYQEKGIGVIVSGQGNVEPEWPYWAADTGCFAAGSNWNSRKWFSWLSGLPTNAMWATIPDVLADAEKTLELSKHWIAPMKELGFRVAFVAQNGLTNALVPWSDIDCLFIGGTTDWKLSEGRRWVIEAKKRSLATHVGRVNSWTRYQMFAEVGCDSADGTSVAFSPDIYIDKISSWFSRLDDVRKQKEQQMSFGI